MLPFNGLRFRVSPSSNSVWHLTSKRVCMGHCGTLQFNGLIKTFFECLSAKIIKHGSEPRWKLVFES